MFDLKENNQGFFTIEAMFATMLILVIVLSVANFTILGIARSRLSQQVEMLSVSTSLNGGLLQADLDNFLNTLEDMGYDKNLITVSVQRLGDSGLEGNFILPNMDSSYVSINDTYNQIHINLSIPIQDAHKPFVLFSVLSETHFERRVMSRRL